MNPPESTPSASGNRLLPAFIFGFSIVLAAALISYGYIQSKKASEFSTATFSGKAERVVESDIAKWSLVLTRYASTTEEAAKLVEQDHEHLRTLVASAGMTDVDYSFHAIQTRDDSYYDDYYSNAPRQVRMQASQVVVIETKQVESMGKLTENPQKNLQGTGIQLRTDRIEYLYSGIDELEKELRKEALKNAHDEARTLLGGQLGDIRSLGRSSLVVTPENASTAYYTSPDTTSIKKKVVVTLEATFRLK